MIFEEKTITLKNGETCVLRSPEIGEAEVLLDYLKKATAETDYLLLSLIHISFILLLLATTFSVP